MSPQFFATALGILIQAGGAGYLVYQSLFTARRLAQFQSQVTYGALGPAIDALAHEVHAQFAHQLRGFVAVLVGSLLQLYGALPQLA